MNNGAFALIDCLGFKGLWKNGHDELLQKLKLVKEVVGNGLQSFNSSAYPLRFNPEIFSVEVRLLSDTVAISVTQSKDENEFSSLLAITTTIQALIDLFLENKPHLFLRGCITYGEHLIEENFLVGQAVDDAAEYMDSAQGAFIWFLPSAATTIENQLASMDDKELLSALFDVMCPPYPVPMKEGNHLNTRVVNPIFNKSPEISSDLMNVCTNVMSVNKMDVWMKQQATLRLLSYCMKRNDDLSQIVQKRKEARRTEEDNGSSQG